MAAMHTLSTPDPTQRPNGPTHEETVLLMKYMHELKAYLTILVGANGETVKRSIKDFMDKLKANDGAKLLASDKKIEWQSAIRELITAWSNKCSSDHKGLHDEVAPRLATLNSLIYTMKQLAPLVSAEDGGPAAFEHGENLLNAVGTVESLQTYDSLVSSGVDTKKITLAIEANLGKTTSAWKRFAGCSVAERLDVFKTACPGLEASCAASIESWINDHLTKFIDTMAKASKHYEDQMTPLKVELDKKVEAAYHLEGAAFLKEFNSTQLKHMSPYHNKFSTLLSSMREVDTHFGLGWNLEEWEVFNTTCRCLSVKWGLYTIYERFPVGLERNWTKLQN